MKKFIKTTTVMILLTGWLNTGYAQQADHIHIHGFGSWGHGRTDGNNYLFGAENGGTDYLDFALAITSKRSENLHLSTQVYWNDHEEAEIDYAFAEWRFSDYARLRLGAVKRPFGIYSEIFDVGTLRPFFSLPGAVYATTGINAEAVHGINLTGSFMQTGGWTLSYDIYTGQMGMEEQGPLPLFDELSEDENEEFSALKTQEDLDESEESEESEESVTLKDVIGGRVTVESPIEGLKLGVSGYSGKVNNPSNKHEVYGVHGEFLSDKWIVRSEYYKYLQGDNGHIDVFYYEAARRLSLNWQIAARIERSQTSLAGENVELAQSLLKHREFAVGLNYWMNAFFVIKLSWHSVEGNRFAKSGLAEELTDASTLDKQTNMLIVGAQFAF